MITIAILLAALGLLIWGFRRAQPYGKLGILAWLQSVVLMAPWLVFFGLSAVGIFLNLATILVLIIGSAGIYIVLGNQLRAESQKSGAANSLKSEFKANHPISFQDSGSDRPPEQSNEPSSSLTPQDESTLEPGEDNVSPSLKTDTESADAVSAPPSSLKPLPDISISNEELQTIQAIFGIDTFFVTEARPYQDGAIFKGNLRGEPETIHRQLSTRLEERMGDRYRLYALEGPDGKPVIVVLPKTNDPKPTTPFQWVVAVVLAIATVTTCLETVGILQGFDLFREPSRIPETLLWGGGILSILAAHEIGHWVKAKQYNIRLSPPFLIPTWQIGSFGALTRFETILPNRTALFDISVAGPLVGGIVSLVFLIFGLSLSHQGSVFQVPTDFFQGSILVGTLARVVLGSQMQQPIVDIHPLTLVGWLGLVITALNLMPAGQLDGGRIVQSIYGRKTAQRTTVATLVVLAIVTLVNPLALYWAIVILFLQRDLERPNLNELTEPNDARAALGLLVLFLMAAVLLPLTPGLAGRLGIGG